MGGWKISAGVIQSYYDDIWCSSENICFMVTTKSIVVWGGVGFDSSSLHHSTQRITDSFSLLSHVRPTSQIELRKDDQAVDPLMYLNDPEI